LLPMMAIIEYSDNGRRDEKKSNQPPLLID